MALSKKTIAALCKAAGISDSELSKAIEAEKEIDIDILVSKSFTEDEWEQHQESIESEKDQLGKNKYDEGKEVGERQLVKKLKEDAGLNYEGKKPEDFIEKFKVKVLEEAKINPDQKVKDLQKDVDALRGTVTEKEEEVKSLNGQLKGIQVERKALEYLPKKLPEGWTPGDALTVMRRDLAFDFDEGGGEVVKKNGEILKDEKTRKPIGFETAIQQYSIDRKWMSPEGGRGGDDEPGGGKTITDHKKARKMSELEPIWKEKGISELSEDARAMVNEAVKDAKESNEVFDYDN